MSTEQLITQHIDTWTSALQTRSTAGRGNNGKIDLYGIKKLRELILELAVRGKLVPQDPNDEPASELLKRIAAEKAELVKQGKIKKQKPLPEISADEKPFELPSGWEWTSIQNICLLENGDRSKNYPNKSTLVESGVPFINAGHLINGVINEMEMTFIKHEHFNSLRSGKFQSGDILFCLRGSLGKSALVNNLSGAIASSLVIVRAYPLVSNKYIELYFNTPLSYRFIKKYDNGTAQPNLAATDLNRFLVPFPPLPEQVRIIAKVTELMFFCDQLEQQSLTSFDAHSQLVEALLATLTNSQNAEELAENWARINQYFDTLFTTEASIDALKQTILKLAVMGKLVPQDPSDEPASELLKRIEQEKAQLVKEGKIKKQKPLQPVSDEERPFDLPEGWEWVRFGSVINIRAELVKPEKHYNSLQVAPDIIEKGTGKVLSKRTVKESGVKGPNSKFYKNQIVYSKIRPSLSKAFIAEYDGLCSADMYPIDCFINSEYLLKVILSEVFLIQVRAAENRIKMPKLNVDSLSNILIPVPPAKVQSVISDRINEMHISSDLLKSRLQSAQQTQLHLADALTDAALS